MIDWDLTNPAQRVLREAIGKLLADPDLRVFLWNMIEEECAVFREGFPINATAYCLLAKQEIGKRLLALAKSVNPEAVYLAEKEWNALVEQTRKDNERRQEENYGR